MEIVTAKRENTYTLISIAGVSGSGKTYSALLMARGLVGPKGKIGFLDTENKRSRFYADVAGGFDVMDIGPPFAPKRYIEAINAFESAGYKALVIDSASHEWEGDGGCVAMADEIEQRTKKPGLHCWKAPKYEHKKFMQRLLQTRMHLIFCCRVKELMRQGKDEHGKSVITSEGFVAIQEKSFIYEMTVSMLLDEKTHIPNLTKCPEDLRVAFPERQMINVDTGAMIKKWSEEGEAVDEKLAGLLDIARSAANLGTEQLRKWFRVELGKADQKVIKRYESELKSIAAAADEREAMAEAAATDDSTMKLGEPEPKKEEKSESLFD